MQLQPHENDILHREIDAAAQALASALESTDPLQVLRSLTWALDTLTATQSELINAILDHGAGWSTIASALSTDSASAERRFPRRHREEPRPATDALPAHLAQPGPWRPD